VKYYLDTEFDGLDGALLSLALVPSWSKAPELYLAMPESPVERSPWVAQNVMPIMSVEGAVPSVCWSESWPARIEAYLRAGVAPGEVPEIVADWPDDIAYFSKLLITGPGTMIDIPGIILQVARVDAYPTDLPGAFQHNALWDARALRRRLTGR